MEKPQFIKFGTELINIHQITSVSLDGNICKVKMSDGKDLDVSYDILAKYIEVHNIDINVSIG